MNQVPWVAESMEHAPEMLQFKNWNLIENCYTRNTSDVKTVLASNLFHCFKLFASLKMGWLAIQSILLNPSLKHSFNCYMSVYLPLLFYSFSQRYVAHLTKSQYDKLGLKDQGSHLEKYVSIVKIFPF